MSQKKRMEKGSEEMKVPLQINNDNEDIFPMHQQEREQEQWKEEVRKV